MTWKTLLPVFILTNLALIGMGQPDTGFYNRRWQQVDSLVLQKGLTQSALQEIDRIYAIAKKNKHEVQVIKSLIYQMELRESREEHAAQKNIAQLNSELQQAKSPYKAILQSLLAQTYWQYYSQHRYQLLLRTPTAGVAAGDFSTWGPQDFQNIIRALYLASLEDTGRLQHTSLAPFAPVIMAGNVRNLRPTLYDLLAHRALEYFKSDEGLLSQPESVFEINQKQAFAPSAEFAVYRFQSMDSSSPPYLALLLFQELIRFHTVDARPDALIDLDLERLAFVNQYATLPDKETLYEEALQSICQKYGKQVPAAAQAWYLLASTYESRAAAYQFPDDTTGQFCYLPAVEICRQVLEQKDSSAAKAQCAVLLGRILKPMLRLQTEKINSSGQAFRTLVSYRNISEVFFRLIPIGPDFKKKINETGPAADRFKELLGMQPLRSFSQVFPLPMDYQVHAAEMKMDGLESGEFVLLASNGPDFNPAKDQMAQQHFYVSNISYLSNGNDFFVLDRETGLPMERAVVQAWKLQWDDKTRKRYLTKGIQYQTDWHGYFCLSPETSRTNSRQMLSIHFGNDSLFLDDEMDAFLENNTNAAIADKKEYEKDNLKTFLFMDRGVYRPGQAVYFKGIVVTRDMDSKKPKIIPGFKTTVFLYDANGIKKDSLQLHTNDYGSYHGTFLLPEGLLNGEFQIADDSSGNSMTFSVEEYKRPGFWVGYAKLPGKIHLGDSVRITGTATAFSGNPITGAKVRFHIQRNARYPYPWRMGRSPRHSGPISRQIAHGEITTDAGGQFSLVFRALPDESVKKEFDPVFDYSIQADVTDLNGETRSGETTIPIGYKALELSINMPKGENMPTDSLKSLFVRSQNLSGLFEPALIHTMIYSLQTPGRLIRERLWPQPDQFVMSESDYLRYFPYDEYRNESHRENWSKKRVVFDRTLLTTPDGQVDLSQEKLSPGAYLIEVSARDSSGGEIRNRQYFQLYEPVTGRPSGPQYNWEFNRETTSSPGQSVQIPIGTNATDVFVIQRVDKNPDSSNNAPSAAYSFFTLSNEMKSTGFRITEAQRGGFSLSFQFIKHNRLYSDEHTIRVPWSNKELQVSYETFRDKTLPGSREKWKIKIRGSQTDRVEAEVVSAMYDASLDQFAPAAWSVPDLFNNDEMQSLWQSHDNFSVSQSIGNYIRGEYYGYYPKIYDALKMGLGITRNSGGSPGLTGHRGYQGNLMLSLAQNEEPAPDGVNDPDGSIMLKRDITDQAPAQAKSEFTLPILFADSARTYRSAGEPAPGREQSVQMRKNFNETAFFMPDLMTDSAGSVSFSFDMPEALTEWKWMTLAHTKDLSFGYSEKKIITQKELMVQPNAPRFLREGDHFDLGVKIVNMSDSEMTGQAELQLIDPTSNQPVDGWFQNMQAYQYFTVSGHQSSLLSFPLQIPYRYDKPVTYRIMARGKRPAGLINAGEEITDGEEASLPVLGNSLLVTETLPLTISPGQSKHIRFEKLLKSGESETLSQRSLTLEFTTNPAWYAVQALPFMMEYPYECAEQSFNRLYANLLGTKIAGSSPQIRQVFNQWEKTDTSALLSALERNQELKTVLLEETPWVLEATSESAQKKNMGRLFDLVRMDREAGTALSKMEDMQSPAGGFPWFKGGPDNRYITQYILAGIGRLKKLNSLPAAMSPRIDSLVIHALGFLDKKMSEDYRELKKAAKTNALPGGLDELQVQYLYIRSFFSANVLHGEDFTALYYFRKQSQLYWTRQNKYLQAMIALSLFRTGDLQTARAIMASLGQNAQQSEELGMYWKEISGGYYWYQAPVEAQSLLMEAFQEITGDYKVVNALRTWLLKNKQTNAWKTTKATADACYALLLQGSDWLSPVPGIQVSLAGKEVISSQMENEPGTGYQKKIIAGPFVSPAMGDVTISMPAVNKKENNGNAGWGALYWQYFENMDKISGRTGAIQITKKLWLEKNSGQGKILEPVMDNGFVRVGDKVIIRIELQVDRDMEFVHMKDMRASCMEPVNILSQYKWQDGLGYYESTLDASTNFFFSELKKGAYVFEYPVFITHAGNFGNGVTTIQCMYAPEFTAHTGSTRVNVDEN